MSNQSADRGASEQCRRLREEVVRFDARIRALSDLGIDLTRPGRELLADLREHADDRRRQHEELEEVKREADRLLLSELVAHYLAGSDADRSFVRGVLAECPAFCWGFGWGLSSRIATAEDARRALAVFSMKDGGSDPRDQVMALGRLCSTIERAGLPTDRLLVEAASWSSDVTRFDKFLSTRALLLKHATLYRY